MTPEDLWLQLLECTASHALGCSPVEHIRAAETLARSEGRREGLEEAARLMDAKAIENICGEAMDEGEWARIWGKLAIVAEKWADKIRALAPTAPPREE